MECDSDEIVFAMLSEEQTRLMNASSQLFAIVASMSATGAITAARCRARVLSDHGLSLSLGVEYRILTAASVDEPVAQLRHAESRDFTQLLLLLLGWVGVGHMIAEPLLQIVSCPLRKIASPSSGRTFFH